jgi:hypothetical protein
VAPYMECGESLVTEDKKSPRQKAQIRRTAFTLLEVLKDQGKINLTETRHRLYPEASHETNDAHCSEIMTEEVFEEFCKLLKVDDKAVEKLGPADIIKDILNDIHVANLCIQSPNTTMEDTQKFMSIKTAKQKLLGQYLGIFKEDKSDKPSESNPDELFRGFSGKPNG